MATNRGGGASRVLGKLKASIQAGNYYEAHQMYRTLYFRYNAQKKYKEMIELLYDGALTLLSHNQHGSGADLSLLLVESLIASETHVTQDLLTKLGKLHELIDPDSPDRPTLVSSALKWSGSKCPQYKSGHPGLQQNLALTLWKEKNYAQAKYHFLHSKDGFNCASMLIEYQTNNGYTSEVDLFVAQTVLEYLCLQNKVTATVVFNVYTKKHPHVQVGPPYIQPLLNFVWLLLLAVEGGRLAVFSILCDKYQTSINRDPNYREYLDRIGQLFFGLPPPQPSQHQGMIGNLIQSLFGMEEEEDGNEPQPSTSQNNLAAMRQMDDLD